jgi:hypothetical protein
VSSDSPVTIKVSPSGSVSLVSTEIITDVSSSVIAESSTATGGSFTGSIEIDTVTILPSSIPSFG